MYVTQFETAGSVQPGSPATACSTASVSLQAPLSALLDRLPESVRGVVRRILIDFCRLLTYQQQVETDVHQGKSLKQTLFMLRLVHDETRALLQFIEAQMAEAAEMDKGFAETLDGMTYAMRHELRRVFEQELRGLNTLDDASQMRARIAHSNGLLSNCFQQSTITLARFFDPTIEAADIFTDYRSRLEQSIQLCHDLTTLSRLVRQAECGQDRSSIVTLVVHLQTFRRGNMHYLMYRDWAEFERLVKTVMATRNVTDLTPVLKQFGCYIETLLCHVRMRSVLSNHPLRFLDDDETEGEAHAAMSYAQVRESA